MLHYDFSEYDKPFGERGVYVTVTAKDDLGHAVSFITNRSGEGEWVRLDTPTGVEYKQVRGTLDPNPHSKDGIRALLRRRFTERYGADA